MSDESPSSSIKSIELVWPGKDVARIPRQQPDGGWIFEAPSAERTVRSLIPRGPLPADESLRPSLAIAGDRLDSLKTLARGMHRSIRLAYLDVPRVEVDDKVAAFRGDPTYVYSDWLSMLRSYLLATLPLLRRDGVLVVHTGDLESPYARLLLEGELGRENHIGTVVWQRAYAPRNPKGMKKFTATHDCLLIFAFDRNALPRVALAQDAEKFQNSDDDPRQEWRAEHKGAKAFRENSDFDTYSSPYTWTIEAGALPRGLWRLNERTGVIWGEPHEVGEFPITVRVTDASGKSARRRLTITIQPTGEPPVAADIPWLFEPFSTTGALRVATKVLPSGVVGQRYVAACLAEGGEVAPAVSKRPGSGRYWEFAKDSLLLAYQEDRVYLGRDGKAIPHPKQYKREVGETSYVNQVTWWPAREGSGKDSAVFVGYTEDATKHLKKLAEMSLIGPAVSATAKPEHLLARLVDIFTEKGDWTLEVFGEAGDLAAVATKRQRRFVYLGGATDHQRELLEQCALRRMDAVVRGLDHDLPDGEIRMRADAYVPYSGGGSYVVCDLSDPLLIKRETDEFPRLNRSAFADLNALRIALLTTEGFLPLASGSRVDGVSFVGREAAVVVGPEKYLTPQSASDIVSRLSGQFDRVRIYYFRATPEFDPQSLREGVMPRRVPSELGV